MHASCVLYVCFDYCMSLGTFSLIKLSSAERRYALDAFQHFTAIEGLDFKPVLKGYNAATKMKKLSTIKQGCRTLIRKQLSLVKGQLGAEYLIILPNINVTSNGYNQFLSLLKKKKWRL